MVSIQFSKIQKKHTFVSGCLSPGCPPSPLLGSDPRQHQVQRKDIRHQNILPTGAQAFDRGGVHHTGGGRDQEGLGPVERVLSKPREQTLADCEETSKSCQVNDSSKKWHLNIHFRFAEFIEGSPHLTEAEVMEYSHFDYNTTDDEEDDEDEILTDDEEAEDAGRD